MISSKILFDKEDYEFMLSYKEVTCMSIQKFVTEAVKRMRERIEIEQELKDIPNIKK